MSTEKELDLTSLVKTGKPDTINILPPALLAAKAMNKKHSIGTIEVELPVLNKKILCNPLTSVDDLTIKTISGSLSAYNDVNFQLLYKSLKFPEDMGIDSYETFIRKFTEADFRASLFGVLNSSFKALEETKFKCKNENCPNPDKNKLFDFAPKMSNIKINYPKPHYISPSGDHTNDIFIATNDILTIHYKFDSIEDKLNLFRTKSNGEIRDNLMTIGSMVPKEDLTINYIDAIEVQTDEEIYKISNKDDIKMFIKTLELSSREEIEKLNTKFINHIESWLPTFSTTVECPHCQSKQEWEDIDLYVEFFRKFTAIFQ